MRLAFIVNDVETEVDEYTTTRLALAAARSGHEVWYVGVGDIDYRPDDHLGARAHGATFHDGDDLARFLERVKATEAHPGIDLDQFDAVMLRNDSVEDLHERPWAANLAVEFGYVLADRGVTVVNEPAGLARAASKLYLEEFPRDIRPRSLISRDRDELVSFVEEIGPTVLKPLYGAKGRNVFMVEDEDEVNLAQIIEALLEDGYVLAQEWIGDDSGGDLRMFLLEGVPLQDDGLYAAVRRVPRGADQRANISTGAQPQPAEITEREIEVARKIAGRLRRDGMFLVGVDMIADKVIEINVESPGGLQSVEHFTGIDFCPAIIDSLQRRVDGSK